MNQYLPQSTLAQAVSSQTAQLVNPAPQPKFWESEVFQLCSASAILAIFLIWASLGKKQPQLTSARMANRWDKLNATNLAFKHIQTTAKGKCNPSAGWCGTPQYMFKFLDLKWSSKVQTFLFNTMPTTWIPDIGRGVLVLGAPGSGKTFSFIDRVIESLLAQGISILLYDKKGDQMKLHTALASRYGYTVDVFAPGGVGAEEGEDPNHLEGKYTCVKSIPSTS